MNGREFRSGIVVGLMIAGVIIISAETGRWAVFAAAFSALSAGWLFGGMYGRGIMIGASAGVFFVARLGLFLEQKSLASKGRG